MDTLSRLYRHSLGLLTDLYQLTMAYGYWKAGQRDTEAVFHLFFRKSPFQSGFTVACGLGYLTDFLRAFRFSDDDISFLASLEGNDGKEMFDGAFLDYLQGMSFECNIDAVPEGTIVFPHEPMVRVSGPLVHCQILETPLLNMMNFQSLIATKAARICLATRGEPVLEFGLRRAQGIDGGLAASRAAYIGGCAATSNVLAGKLFGIPVKGTHAHSWVMCFDGELEAFEAYADVMPNNCVFLVDTYETLEGVRNAVRVGCELRARGHEMVGIRLDSGDLAYLSIEARKILDDAGFPDAAIVASNDLDEWVIASLKEQGAKIGVWGVGTKLATAYEQPALGGVYKLAGVRTGGGSWIPKVKLSEQAIKTSIPGFQQVRRYRDDKGFLADAIYCPDTPLSNGCVIVDPMDATRRKQIASGTDFDDLLLPIFRGGNLDYEVPSLSETRTYVQEQLDSFHPSIKRLLNPHQYPVGLELNLHLLRTKLILSARGEVVNLTQ